MVIDTQKIITVTEANRNFSRPTRIADTYGEALVFKNNRPKYKLINLELEPNLELTDDEKIDVVARHTTQHMIIILPIRRRSKGCRTNGKMTSHLLTNPTIPVHI